MSYAEFYLTGESGSSNLNSGTTTADVGGGSGAAIYTSTGGNFDGTLTFTPTDNSTPANTISAGMYAALYNTGDTVARAIGLIATVNSGVNGTIVIDGTIKYGTVPTSNSGSRAIKVGGALADVGCFTSPGAFNVAATVPQDTRINYKAVTTASTTTARSVGAAGSATLGVWIRGYKTTPGDQDSNNLAVAGTDIPSLTFTTGSLTVGTGTIISNMAFSGARTAAAQVVTGTLCELYRVRITNTGAGATAQALGLAASCRVVASNLTISSTSATILTGVTSTSLFAGNVFSGGLNVASTGAQTNIWGFNTFSGQAGDIVAMTTGGVSQFIGNTFYNAAGNGISWSSTPAGMSCVMNNIFHTINQASKSAVNNTSGTSTWLITCIGNGYYNCTATLTGINENFAIFDNGVLGSDPFVNAAGGNFATTPAAQVIGFPGYGHEFENVSAYNGFLGLGAVQGGLANRSRSFSGF